MNNCACIYVDYEPLDTVTNENRRARKEHVCGECGRIIDAGEIYEYVFGKFDDVTETYKTCADCLSVRNSFFCSGWGYTRIWEDLHEHLSDLVSCGSGVSSECMMPLTKVARDTVCDTIEELWDDDDDA